MTRRPPRSPLFPYTPLSRSKTIVLELLQQLAWQPPDWIVVPAGNLGNTAAFGKALAEACEWGVIDRLPRLAAVQAEGAAPFADRKSTRLNSSHGYISYAVFC